MIIEDISKKYIIEITSRLTIDTIGRQLVLKTLLGSTELNNTAPEFVIASKLIPSEIERIAKSCDIRIITVPYRSKITSKSVPSDVRRIEKISSPKAWRIVMILLIGNATSVRQISLKADVSYGWAHATVKSLIAKGIVAENKYFQLHDIPKLLNGIAWERPFEKLFYDERVLPESDAISAARMITRMCDSQDIECGFTSFTAGGIYTQYGFRHDSVYVYITEKHLDQFLDSFEATEKQGITVRVYKPDRDVFSDTRMIEDIRLVSPAQTLLDLAGMGYSGRDLTVQLVEKYARL
ncbi:hypothetical protein J2T58_001360 [Methanocalculus alkaliphilus]|uniref:hypothetical protein n=1 Tax=Methanocalculus alkaliphilus TaxID=768730 RepID=UPI00209F89B7|nr:hypothetical protein [Methanocalculus alkaliphilus]MCP1715495.1 hypothetical protein [Methanocalculus alkaliphilus]